MTQETRGMWLGLIGAAIFSLTLPFTRMAVAELNPIFVALGRAVVAAFCSGALLWYLGAARPSPAQWRALVVVSLGVVVGFPVFASVAMVYVPASHGAIVLGILPLATALFGALRFGERPSIGFWLAALVGSAIVVAFALIDGEGAGNGLHPADLALFAAVIAAAMGYAEGARLSQTMGGQQVISWALVLALPVLLPITAWYGWRYGVDRLAAGLGRVPVRVAVFDVYRFLFLVQGTGPGRHRARRPDPVAATVHDAGGRRLDRQRAAAVAPDPVRLRGDRGGRDRAPHAGAALRMFTPAQRI